MWHRSLVRGLIFGGSIFAIVSGVLFWPRVLREPYAPNPGPFIVILGALAGVCFGTTSALAGKLINRFSLRPPNRTSK